MVLIIGLVLLAIGLVVVGTVVVRATPRMRVLRLPKRPRASARSGREAALKEQIILNRLTRQVRGVLDEVGRRGRATFGSVGPALERGYRRLRLLAQEHAVPPEPGAEEASCDACIAAARDAVAAGDLEVAEDQFLACLKRDAKNFDAYLGLATLYRDRKELGLAEETLAFLRKLHADRPEVHVALAEVLQAREKHAAALAALQHALRIEPKNPRFLDFAATLAIVVRDVAKARSFLVRLREANPDNQKLEELEEQIAAIGRAAPRASLGARRGSSEVEQLHGKE